MGPEEMEKIATWIDRVIVSRGDTLVQEEVIKQNNKRDFNPEFKKLVKKRIALTHKKLIEQNNQKKFNEDLKRLIEKRFAIVQKELIVKRFSQ